MSSETDPGVRQPGPYQANPEARKDVRADHGGETDDAVAETAVLLDSAIHDLRTPLSAMSGWLEVLETHFGEADGIVGRALLGLRRGVDSQTASLSGLSDVLMRLRISVPDNVECVLLARLQLALKHMAGTDDSPLNAAEKARLDPLRQVDPSGSVLCKDAGASLGDALVTLLHALAVSQSAEDPSMRIAARDDELIVTVPGATGDRTPLISLCQGLEGYATRRPEVRAQALWFARTVMQRCGLALEMRAAGADGFDLHLRRRPAV